MPKNRKTILIIPPKGSRARAVRVRGGVMIFLLLIFIGGFAGYFIPFNSLTLDVVEQNQKKNLTVQNQKLLHKMTSIITVLHKFNTRVEALANRRKEMEEIVNIKVQPDTLKKVKKSVTQPKTIDEMFRYALSTEAVYSSIVEKIKSDSSYFGKLPVLRPVGREGVITAIFGKKREPFSGEIKWHNGVDFAAERKTPVYATASGTVISVENHRFWGNRVFIKHCCDFTTVYAHLGDVRVAKGKKVDRGDVIGTIGLSGLTTGPHVHYEIWYKGEAVNPQDYFLPQPPPALVSESGNSDDNG